MLGGGTLPKLDSEIIDNEREGDTVGIVAEQTGGGGLMISVGSEVPDEFILRYLAGVG